MEGDYIAFIRTKGMVTCRRRPDRSGEGPEADRNRVWRARRIELQTGQLYCEERKPTL